MDGNLDNLDIFYAVGRLRRYTPKFWSLSPKEIWETLQILAFTTVARYLPVLERL